MNTVQRFYNSSARWGIGLAVVMLLASCGSDEAKPAAPQPPAGTPPPPPGLTGGFESSPGTPLAFNMAEIYKNLIGSGSAVVTSETSTTYTIDYGNGQQPATLRPLGSPISQPQPQLSSFILSGTPAQNGLRLALYSQFGGWRQFEFVPYIVVGNAVRVSSTDIQAIFISQNAPMGPGPAPMGGVSVIKVAYRQPNPPMQLFSVQEINPAMGGGYFGHQPGPSGGFGGGGGFGYPQQPGVPYFPQGPGIMLQVIQKNMTTTFQYQNQSGTPAGMPQGYPAGYPQNPFGPSPYGYPGAQPFAGGPTGAPAPGYWPPAGQMPQPYPGYGY